MTNMTMAFDGVRELSVDEIDAVAGATPKLLIVPALKWAAKEFAKKAVQGASTATGAGAAGAAAYGVGKATGMIE